MTREEHLAWAKQRALDELERGSYINAIASMLSDLGKHEAWDDPNLRMALHATALTVHGPESCRRWIEGFN